MFVDQIWIKFFEESECTLIEVNGLPDECRSEKFFALQKQRQTTVSRCSELCVEYVVSSKNQTFILHVDEREVTGLCPALALCSGSLTPIKDKPLPVYETRHRSNATSCGSLISRSYDLLPFEQLQLGQKIQCYIDKRPGQYLYGAIRYKRIGTFWRRHRSNNLILIMPLSIGKPWKVAFVLPS